MVNGELKKEFFRRCFDYQFSIINYQLLTY